MREVKGFRTVYADKGKRLLINDTLHDKVILAQNSRLRFQEIEVPEYIEEASTLEEIKEKLILALKSNLSDYLLDNPLQSTVKYSEGRLYSVTLEKQQQLTSKLLLYNLYTSQNIPYQLTWNDTGNICESWSSEELSTLSMQIDAYVTPLVKMQQTIEVKIKDSTSIEDVLQIDISYSSDNIEKYINK